LNDTERISDWIRYYNGASLKFNALRAVYEKDGEKMLAVVLKKLGLASALDVVKACDDCYYIRK
jgi:hypothetical protein